MNKLVFSLFHKIRSFNAPDKDWYQMQTRAYQSSGCLGVVTKGQKITIAKSLNKTFVLAEETSRVPVAFICDKVTKEQRYMPLVSLNTKI